jgi:lipoprotein-anchoring transpeptidase ErfK/SrfK
MLWSRVSCLASGFILLASAASAAEPVAVTAAGESAGSAPLVAPPAADQAKPSDDTPPTATAASDEAKPAAPARPTAPPVTLVAKVDLTSQRMTVLVNGKPMHAWAISSGAQGYATPVGMFQPGWMAKMWYSRQYDDAPMPHAVFFKNGAAIHATQATGSLGRPASHGCVRLAPANAETFYKLVAQHSLARTRVHVFGTPNHPAASIARYDARQPQRASIGYVNASPPAGYASRGTWFGGSNYMGSGFGPRPSQPTYVRTFDTPARAVVIVRRQAPAAAMQFARPRTAGYVPRGYGVR